MKRLTVFLTVALLTLAGGGCGGGDEEPAASAKPKATPKAVPVGGVKKMGTFVRTEAGSRIVVLRWIKGAPERPDPPGPGQVYETIQIGFCAGPEVDVTGPELARYFFLELPNGNRVAPDSLSGKNELRAKGKIDPDDCILSAVVFQVGGGTKPTSVIFQSSPPTKWTVP